LSWRWRRGAGGADRIGLRGQKKILRPPVYLECTVGSERGDKSLLNA
jgi:hypothetical protein